MRRLSASPPGRLLARAHLPELSGAVMEPRRVLAPGGRLIASVLDPLPAALGWQALFSGPDGGRGFVHEHPHTQPTTWPRWAPPA